MARRLPGSYGVDAPYVPALSALGGAVLVVLALVTDGWSRWLLAAFGLAVFGQAALYLSTTLRGKFAIWRRVVDDLDLAGSEVVLDVGCGRGMVLLEAARGLPQGRAIGVDLWRSRDQSGNDPARARLNASLVGVADRVEIATGDMTALPFRDGSFDAVLANVAIQNLKDRELRRRAISEMVRVAGPAGRIRIVDIQYVSQYRDDLVACGATEVAVRRLGPRGWFGNPFYASRLVRARMAG